MAGSNSQIRRRKTREKQSSKNKQKNKGDETNDTNDNGTASAINSGHAPSVGKKDYFIGFLIIFILGIAILLAVLPWEEKSQQQQQQQRRQQQQQQQQNQRQRQLEEERALYTQVSSSYEVIQMLPHDTKAFTQGLQFDPDDSNMLYESTGMYGESEMRVYYDFPKMETQESIILDEAYFGEGCTIFYQQDQEQAEGPPVMTKKLIQLTWKEQKGYIYLLEPELQLTQEFRYTTTNNQGWGITYNPNNHTLIVTDGTQYLHVWDADTLEQLDRIEVKYQRIEMKETGPRSATYLNELEYDDSTKTILANVFLSNFILRIDATTGFAQKIYDFTNLYINRDKKADVFNGIALRDNTELWVTGKYWPNLYQIKLND